MLIKHNLIGRKTYLSLVSGSSIPSIHNHEYNTELLYVHYCKGRFGFVVVAHINKT